MSLITRCPACGTQFRVVRDQLKISEGWVRCGQCGEVFDAQDFLQESPAPASEPAVEPAPASEPPVEPAPAPAPALEPKPEPEPEPPSPVRPEPALETVLEPEPAQVPPTPPAPGPIEPVFEPAFEPEKTTPASKAPPEDEPDPSPEAKLDEVSFVRQARRRAFWHRPGVRGLLVVFSVLLGGLLALQVAVQQHDLLAARLPSLRPALEALCQPLGCRIGPPRRIEAVVIDSSSFTRLRPDAFRLSVSLSNQSATVVAMPALELTLTDSQDQPVLRRVIAPAELGQGAAGVIGAKAEWSTALTVAVTPNGNTGRIAGYRLLAFYP